MSRSTDSRPGAPSLIIETGTRAIFHTIVLFSLYLLFAGHNRPGGGFVGGLTAGAACVLVYAAFGARGLSTAVPVHPETLLGVGILLAGGTGAAALVVGAEFLSSGYVSVPVPVIGELHLTSVLVFDTGVYTVVVGLVLALLSTLGGEAAT